MEARLKIHDLRTVWFFSFPFQDESGQRFTADRIQGFRAWMAANRGPEAARYDRPKTMHSFDPHFVAGLGEPTSLPPDAPEGHFRRMPLVCGMDVGELGRGKALADDVPKGRRDVPTQVEVRVAHYGVGTVRVVFEETGPAEFSEELIESHLVKWQQGIAETYAKSAWERFLSSWELFNAEPRRDPTPPPTSIDTYLTLITGRVEATGSFGTIRLSALKSDAQVLDEAAKAALQRRLVGLAITSFRWPFYWRPFVEEFLRSDLSTTVEEFQFIRWRNSLIYNDEPEKVDPAPFRSYEYDLLLALETLFMMRGALRMLQPRLRPLFAPEIIQTLTSGSRVVWDKDAARRLQLLEEWIGLVMDWRSFHRHAVISHFERFVQAGLDAMRIDTWLGAINDDLDQFREALETHSDRSVARQLFIWTMVVTLLTLLLVVFEAISRLQPGLGGH